MDLTQARHGFVTGGASGIGLAIADALAARGIAVTIADIDEQRMAAVLAKRSGRFRGTILDISDRAAWAKAKREAEEAFGPVDLLINNAAIPAGGAHLADMEPEIFDRAIAVNLTGVFNGVSTFGKDMRAAGRGHIVNTSSMQGVVVDGPGVGSYGSSKAGVVALSEVLRHEMAPHGVGVSAFCPGVTMTPMVEAAMKRMAGSDLGASLRLTPMPPERVAGIVLRGIEEDRPYIFTHLGRRAAVEKRCEALLAGFDGLEE